MSDVILAIAIFHSLCAVALISASAVSACRGLRRRRVLAASLPRANPGYTLTNRAVQTA